MNRDDILEKLKNAIPNIGPSIVEAFAGMHQSEVPKFSFALREDLKDEKQFLPTRAEPMSSGWDVKFAPVDRKSITIKPFEYVKLPLGFRCFCPQNFWYQLKPRSSSFAKLNLHALYGTIDETYGLEAVFACQYIPNRDGKISNNITIEFGQSIGQIIPVRRQEMIVSEMSNDDIEAAFNERNAVRVGGFGSTDVKK